ncbi:Monoglyceride lipase, partial [Stegodyphus mimosarum]
MPPGEQLAPLSADVVYYNKEFLNKRDQKIYCYYWKPAEVPKAILLISHGFTEHCMMYDELAHEMARRRFFVFAHDHMGHGHSEGTRAYMNCMHELVEDSVRHIKLVQEEYPNLPLFICGHSMGGSISLLTSLEKEIEVSGVVLIAPALAPNPETATFFKVMAVKLLNKFMPHFPVAVSDFGLSCQNEKKVEEMKNDPLRHHGYWKMRPVMCLLESGQEILNKSTDVKFPILVLHGDNDKICHLSGATNLYEKATSSDKTLKIYPGAYHSLLNEPEEIADDVFDQTVQWLEERA